jgi:uncharacterized membrane protein
MINQLGEAFERFLEPWAEKIEKRKLLLLSVFSGFYFAGFCLLAAEKVMWNDELFTYYIARLPHLSDVWNALLTGAEQTPPLSYAVTRAVWGILGVSNLTTRLPEIIGIWLMGLCLLVFVARRTTFLYGFVAMLFPLVTEAFHYATEARAYALVLAFSAFALVSWQWAAEGRRRRLALVGLGAGVAAAVSSHYYAVLILFPLSLGEFVRSARRKRIDTAVWIALCLGLTPLVVFLPLIRSARSYAPHFWAKPQWISMLDFYHRFLLPPTVLALALILVLVMAYSALRPAARASKPPLDVPAHELAAVLGFVFIPVAGVILAKTVIGAYDDRYAFPAVIGFCIVVGWGLACAFDRSAAMALAVCAMLFGAMIAKDVRSYHSVVEDRAVREATYAFLEQHAAGAAPIVIANPAPFVELSHRPPAELRARLLYLVDPQLGLENTGTDDIERGVVEMKRWAGMNVQSFPAYIASGRQCFIYVQNYPDQFEWLIPEMVKTHWKLSLVGWHGLDMLFLAAPGGEEDSIRGQK